MAGHVVLVESARVTLVPLSRFVWPYPAATLPRYRRGDKRHRSDGECSMVMSPPTFALLRDGAQVLIRPFEPADRAGGEALFARLSPETRALRFHSAGLRMTPATVDLVTMGHALVAEREGRIVALASYSPLRDPTRAEMSIAVEDAEHGRGIGTALFDQL